LIGTFLIGAYVMNKHSIESLILNYLAEKDITSGTYDLYIRILKQYTKYLIDNQIVFAKTRDIINYLEWKRGQGYTTHWLYHQTTAIKGLYRYLSSNQKRLKLPEEYAQNITESIKNERINHKVSKPILTIEQAKKLLLFTKNNRKYIWHYRDYAIFYLMITTGLRSVEIRRAKRKDLRIVDNQLILYIQGKGRRSTDDFVKISKGVEEALNDYFKKRKDKNPYLFIVYRHRTTNPMISRSFFNKMIQRIFKESGLEDTGITAHSLRHTAATLNLLRGGTLESTRQFMRHTNMSTTLIYAHLVERMKNDSENLIEDYILGEDKISD
jgi:site-specific recombinase XerD